MEDQEEIKKQISDLETKLLEQEHRPLTILRNYSNRNKYPKGDPRRRAVFVSFFWRMFFSPGVIATGGGIIALISLVLLFWQSKILIQQNGLIVDQNNLVKYQNQKITDQNYLVEAQRRSTLQFEISEILNRVDEELKKDKERRLSNQLIGRIIAATNSLKPYRSYENDTLSQPYSYEKGHLFISLIKSKISGEDLSVIFADGDFSGMILKNITLGERIKINQKDSLNVNEKLSSGSLVKLDKIKFSNCYFKNVIMFSMHFSNEIIFENSIVDNLSSNFSLSKKIVLSETLISNSYIQVGILKESESIKPISYGDVGDALFNEPTTIHLNNSDIENSIVRLSYNNTKFSKDHLFIQSDNNNHIRNSSFIGYEALFYSRLNGNLKISNCYYSPPKNNRKIFLSMGKIKIQNLYSRDSIELIDIGSDKVIQPKMMPRISFPEKPPFKFLGEYQNSYLLSESTDPVHVYNTYYSYTLDDKIKTQ
ncbi:hypothetical protein J8L88_09905 [Aquimarina sp. MMG015]|uniref:hypothetical protein n=1 Tax=Aquimarina sp. MMG015 TaxID=2822689 RepID=UPI001B3A39D5|nr:hypothetical protein [Aquimarina sp. MMG015]MBQ4803162.1 hypothetical protein [Aquimarina sp. MMG015]